MALLSPHEKRYIVAPKIDVDNSFDLVSDWVLQNSGSRKDKLETLKRMRDLRDRLSSRGNGITEPEVVNYSDSILNGFRKIMCGENEQGVLNRAATAIKSISVAVPKGESPEAKVVLVDYRDFAELYYPLITLKTSRGLYDGNFERKEKAWWKAVALHNFEGGTRGYQRPRIKLDEECFEWLRKLPTEYKEVLAKLTVYKGDWSAVTHSTDLASKFGKDVVDTSIKDLSDYSKHRADISKPVILSLYFPLLNGEPA